MTSIRVGWMAGAGGPWRESFCDSLLRHLAVPFICSGSGWELAAGSWPRQWLVYS